jgi:phosphatidylglycerophosphate synthase
MSPSSGQGAGDHLRSGAIRAFAAALLASIALAWGARFVFPLSVRFPVVVAVIFGFVMLLAIVGLPGRHPFERFGAANHVTMVRAALAALVAGLVAERPLPVLAAAAAGTASVLMALDGVDGWLARRTRLSSAFGARFDLEVDAFLILVLAILAWRHGKAGAWILLAGLLRYVFVASGALWTWMEKPLRPSMRRQAVCVVQIGGLIVALLPMVPPPRSAEVAAAALAALCYSFFVDTLWLWRNAS